MPFFNTTMSVRFRLVLYGIVELRGVAILWPSLQFMGGLQGSCSKPIRVHTEFPAIPFKSICPLDGNICISFNNYSKGFAK